MDELKQYLNEKIEQYNKSFEFYDSMAEETPIEIVAGWHECTAILNKIKEIEEKETK
jgi:hypothetical protein